jgi:epoxide hydrolase-like predicted phosphatase
VAIEAVIFDIGGVLEVTPPTGWLERWASALALSSEELIARLEPTFAAGSTGAMTLAEVERANAEALGLDAATVGQLAEDLWSEYLGRLNEKLADYFARLRPRYRTGILSNSFVGARERERDRYGLEQMCDVIVYSHEEGMLKPDPRFYLIACQRLGASPRRCVLLDDARANVDGARAVGMHAITFVDNVQAIRDLETVLNAGPPCAS